MNEQKLNLVLIFLGILVLVSIQPYVRNFSYMFSGIGFLESNAGIGIQSAKCYDLENAYNTYQSMTDGYGNIPHYGEMMNFFLMEASYLGC